MSLEFPHTLGDWSVHTDPPSEVEIAILAHDSNFAKAACFLKRHEERSYITGEAPTDRADLSIILSGHALAKPFHRPERALYVQGHQQLQTSSSEITLKNGLTIPVKRILSKVTVDETTTIETVNYSVFVGHSSITASHFQRTLIDVKDRVLHAEDQRWAYILASMRYRDQQEPARGDPPNLESADRKLRDLLVELMENNLSGSLIDN